MQLPPEERERLAEILFSSVDVPPDHNEAWDTEIDHRVNRRGHRLITVWSPDEPETMDSALPGAEWLIAESVGMTQGMDDRGHRRNRRST